jgi:hypothetical protein
MARGLHQLGAIDQETMNRLQALPRAVRIASAHVISVVLQPDEEVRWIWTPRRSKRSPRGKR